MKRIQIKPRATCALCLEQGMPCKSHIIPNSLYAPVFASEGFGLLKSAVNAAGTRKVQTGFYERLLCLGCEQKFSVWETYGRELLLGQVSALTAMPIPDIPGATQYTGIDYVKFKLFQLSILWRASVCRNEFFDHVNLGPREEDLRQMLLASDPGQVSDFGCMIFRLTLRGMPATGVVQGPATSRAGIFRTIRFVFGGMLWEFYVSRALPGAAPLACMVQEAGTLTLLPIVFTDLKTTRDITNKVLAKEHLKRYRDKIAAAPASVLR